jgi:hypothetical protein
MQGDVVSRHQHQSGFAYIGRTRIKAYSVRGTSGAAARLDVFDSLVAPTAATYAQSAYTVTVTKSAHGLSTGDVVGISFDDGDSGEGTAAANSGNFVITKLTDNTFTITMINSITIDATAPCRYVVVDPNIGGGWVMTIEAAAGDIYNNYYLLPQQGILIRNGIYSDMEGVVSMNYWIG